MILNSGNTDYRLNFSHYEDENGRATACTIERVEAGGRFKDDGSQIGTVGKAQCAPEDNFCKATGRKISLTRALSTVDKAERSDIWDAYLANQPS